MKNKSGFGKIAVFLLAASSLFWAGKVSAQPRLNSSEARFEISSDQKSVFDQPFESTEQWRHAAKEFVFDQEKLIQDVLHLASELDQKKQSLVESLGRERRQKILQALQLPEDSVLKKNKKMGMLDRLEYSQFQGMDLYSSAQDRQWGEKVYFLRSLRGELISDFEVRIPGLGRAEPTNDDGVVYPRVVHERTGLRFLLLPYDFNMESKAFKVHLARMNMRFPVVALKRSFNEVQYSDDGKPLRYRLFPRPVGFVEKTQNWWTANYVSPDKKAAVIAGLNVSIQVATTEGCEAYNYFIRGQEWNHTASYLSAGYAILFGLWASFYNNMTTPYDPLSSTERIKKMLLRTAISTATYTYILQAANHGIESLSLTSTGGLLTHTVLLSNILLANTIKDKWRLLNDLDDQNGTSRGNAKVLGTSVKKTQLRRAVTQQVTNSLRYFDMIGVSVLIFGKEFPVGSALFYSSFLWSQYVVLQYVEKKGYPEAPILRSRWEELVSRPITYLKYVSESSSDLMSDPKLYFKNLIRFALDDFKSLTDFCRAMVRRETDQRQKVKHPLRLSEDGEWIEITVI